MDDYPSVYQQEALPLYGGRCSPQSPPHGRRPLLSFPPPPAYPPPHRAKAKKKSAGEVIADAEHAEPLIQDLNQKALLSLATNPRVNPNSVPLNPDSKGENPNPFMVSNHRSFYPQETEALEGFTTNPFNPNPNPFRQSSEHSYRPQHSNEVRGGHCQVDPTNRHSQVVSRSDAPPREGSPIPGPSWADGSCGHSQQDYSYAYYEPGPPTKHVNVPSRHPITGFRDRTSRHTYLTRYGTEENIYEEITDVARARMRSHKHQQDSSSGYHSQGYPDDYPHHRKGASYKKHSGQPQGTLERATRPSAHSLTQSIVEEEFRRVQHRHRRVLDELNLSVEAMLMPGGSQDEDSQEQDDTLADLLTVGPTDDLLSPAPLDLDSGFSGSSSGASYQSAVGSLRRARTPGGCGQAGCSGAKPGAPSPGGAPGGSGKGFWGRKAWKKLAGFGLSKTTDEPRVRSGWDEEASPLPATPRVPGPPHPALSGPRMPGGIPPVVGSAAGPPGGRRLEHGGSQRTLSSEESWGSGSDGEISSDEESDRSAGSSVRSNGQLRNTLNKARSLWRSSQVAPPGGGQGGVTSTPCTAGSAPLVQGGDGSPGGRLARWFSIRRGSTHQYDVEGSDSGASTPTRGGGGGGKMPLLPEVEEEAANLVKCMFGQRRQVAPSLPPAPADITPQQQKRRLIVAAIVHSENSYVATLQRLVNDYKKPLEESSPPILSNSKISTLFHRLPEILQCHTLFRIALAECVRNWDHDEKIGDVFVASFSKAIVLDIYSGFINNFSVAMDLAKMEAKRKSALADFLKVKQISSHDRLSFFGLMVKPVQRFPQFILFLQDLLKHTPQGHHDRMSLQLALTQLESLAEMLNERKREAEQFQAFKETLRHIGGKFSARPLSDGNRCLLREDNVTQLEFNQCGLLTKSKSRRLLLLNDLIVCVSVAPKQSDDFGASERLTLKWTYPVTDVEIQDTSTSPTLSRILTAGLNRGGSLKSNGSNVSSADSSCKVSGDNLCSEMSNLMHDFEVMSRVQDLVSSLKGDYQDMTVEHTRRILNSIQSSMQQKDEEMAWVDSCCLQLVVRNKGKEEVYTFQTDNPSVKKEWVTELRLAQLALDTNNSPAWEVPEQEQRPSTKMPLFVRAQAVYRSQHQTEVRCGCFYTVNALKPTRRKHRNQSYLWVCTSDGISSHIAVLAQHQQQAGSLKDVGAFDLVETQVTDMEFVRGVHSQASNTSMDTVWMGTDSRKLLLYNAGEPERQEELSSCTVPAIIVQIKYHCDSVFVALGSGSLLVYRRNLDGTWLLKEPQTLNLGLDTVSCLLPINLSVYAACGKKVWVLNGLTGEIQKNFSVQHEHVGNVNLMAHSGIGLWISLKNSSTICLYHTETFKHLQDINIASNVMRVTTNPESTMPNTNNNRSQVNVTSLMACKGLLWVGTNVGICLTIPLPRLEGVPIISGRVNISYHAHFGPISFLLALQPKSNVVRDDKPETEMKPKIEKQLSDSSQTAKLRQQLTNSPVVLRRRRSKECDMSRLSKTLPRGLGSGLGVLSTSTTSSQSSGDTCDVYGLYGELMYIKDYEGDDGNLDPVYESLRRSDPELAAIPGKVSTLDRRLKLKVSRPRSLDLSNWSVDSRSSSLYTSSGSEESMAVRNGRSVSRNNSNASRTLCEDTIDEAVVLTTKAVSTKTLPKCGSLVDAPRRTVITLMGGRGYVNWRQPCCDRKGAAKEPNCTDAHVVIWELKL